MLTKSLRRALKHFYRDHHVPARLTPRQRMGQVCAENAALRATLDKYVVDGMLGVVQHGMDCDCTQYYREYVMPAPAGAAALKQWHASREANLDGPETVYFKRPQDVEKQSRSRDLALMAYEDGHPHVVYPVGYDELMPS